MRRSVPALLTLVFLAATAPAQEKPGAKEFQNYCTACHRYDGQNMGEAPPLHDSPWVEGPSEWLIKIVLHGVRGRIEIKGEVYDREMPGFGAILSDKRIAELVTFVRATFGNDEDPVRASAVKEIREKHKNRDDYWHVDELRRGK